jgi:hypothetical protein
MPDAASPAPPSALAPSMGHDTSAGHATATPSQVSAGSHDAIAERHDTPAASTTSGGQVALDPLHTSATSQVPREDRHSTPARNRGEHSTLDPVHRSGVSQTSATAGSQIVVAGANAT